MRKRLKHYEKVIILSEKSFYDFTRKNQNIMRIKLWFNEKKVVILWEKSWDVRKSWNFVTKIGILSEKMVWFYEEKKLKYYERKIVIYEEKVEIWEKKFRYYEKKLKYYENKIEILTRKKLNLWTSRFYRQPALMWLRGELQIQILNELQDPGRNSSNLFGDPKNPLMTHMWVLTQSLGITDINDSSVFSPFWIHPLFSCVYWQLQPWGCVAVTSVFDKTRCTQ